MTATKCENAKNIYLVFLDFRGAYKFTVQLCRNLAGVLLIKGVLDFRIKNSAKYERRNNICCLTAVQD